MEAFALLFVIGLFIALISPEIKPRPKSAGNKLLEGLQAAANEIFAEDIVSKGKKPKPKPKPWGSPWAVMFYTILLGILLTYL
ncbi:MAG: hypothetical protein AAF892_06750 [Cyanobacteria bacterium P01_D01_bin.71]